MQINYGVENPVNNSIKMEPSNSELQSSVGCVPNFQISMPSSFQGGQPNFYTELNQTAVTINQPTSNFGHTADIDEDYDTS